MPEINIAFDLDDTLVNMMSVFDDYLEAQHGRRMPESYDQFDISGPAQLTKKEIWFLFYQVFDDINRFPIYPGAREVLTKLYEITGEPPCILTARPHRKASETYALVKRLMKKTPFTLILQHPDMSKAGHLMAMGYGHYVDDRRKNVLDIARAGIHAFMPERCYNQIPADVIKASGNIGVIDGMTHFLPYLSQFATKKVIRHDLAA
ncbi:MAG: hypothetical protein JEZ11_03990 [Desulfobacterales bacterium]|nr:hypothetical protein [Desulfobacterales bacterium]